MPHEQTASSAPGVRLIEQLPAFWRVPLAQLLLAFCIILSLTWRDWAAMADQWWNVSTYNHILLIPPVFAWLVWQRRDALRQLEPQAWWPGLIIVAGAFFLWLLGSVSGLNLARQLGAVTALQGVLLALLGPRIAAAALFPLGYLLFLVPFGDELVPALQMITADITIALTHWSGIPAEIDGVFIDTPVGLFEVAEACSGVKFLVAMAALGTLAAHVCFKSWTRRILFMALALLVPILANGVRAWGTIFIAQSQGIEFASGFDHIFYGWIFFALVMGLVLGLAWRFFDRDPFEPFVSSAQIAHSPILNRLILFRTNGWYALIGAGLLAAAFGAWSAAAAKVSADVPDEISLPQVAGWELLPFSTNMWWEPRASGADHRLLGRYENANGQQVDVFYAYYSSQSDGKEAGAFGEGALIPDTPWRWLDFGPDIAGAKTDRLLAHGKFVRVAATFYRTGDLLTGSNTALKLANMRDRVLLRPNPTHLLILSMEEREVRNARESIYAFRTSVGDLGDWMDQLAKGS